MLKISMESPTLEEEVALAERSLGAQAPERILEEGAVQAVLSAEALQAVRAYFEGVTVRPELLRYIVDLSRKTREHASILVGAGPRATQALLWASRVQAVLEGRDFITPDDVKAMALPVFTHRLTLRPEYEIEGLTAREVSEQILEDVTVPR